VATSGGHWKALYRAARSGDLVELDAWLGHEWDLIVEPDDGRCDLPAHLEFVDTEGNTITTTRSDGCAAVTADLPAGDVLVCADVDTPSTLRVARTSERVRLDPPDQCSLGGENDFTRLFCPEGTIERIVVADWGLPTGSCAEGFTLDPGCSSDQRDNGALTGCIGLQECFAFNDTFAFGDPCEGVGKRLVVDFMTAAPTT